MNTRITARHFHASPALRAYVTDRLSKLEKYYNGITDVHVVLHKEPSQQAAEITLNVYRQRLAAQDAAPTYEEAVDRCITRLRRQISRYKARLRSNHRNEHH